MYREHYTILFSNFQHLFADNTTCKRLSHVLYDLTSVDIVAPFTHLVVKLGAGVGTVHLQVRIPNIQPRRQPYAAFIGIDSQHARPTKLHRLTRHEVAQHILSIAPQPADVAVRTAVNVDDALGFVEVHLDPSLHLEEKL